MQQPEHDDDLRHRFYLLIAWTWTAQEIDLLSRVCEWSMLPIDH
jgi:hypothetical protein